MQLCTMLGSYIGAGPSCDQTDLWLAVVEAIVMFVVAYGLVFLVRAPLQLLILRGLLGNAWGLVFPESSSGCLGRVRTFFESIIPTFLLFALFTDIVYVVAVYTQHYEYAAAWFGVVVGWELIAAPSTVALTCLDECTRKKVDDTLCDDNKSGLKGIEVRVLTEVLVLDAIEALFFGAVATVFSQLVVVHVLA